MNGRGKSARLCLVFTLAGVLTVLCMARTSVSVPSSVSHYLDIVMAVLMVVLLLCVLELCLGVELCVGSCRTRRRTTQDAESQNGSGLSALEPGEAPPSYEVIMAQGGPETHAGGAAAAAAGRGGRSRDQDRETEPLKREVYVYFKNYTTPSKRLSVSRDVSETSLGSASELWLSVDGLPSYEEAMARCWEEEMVSRLQEEAVARFQEEEIMARIREEAVARLQEEVAMRLQEEEMMARLQEEAGVRLQEEETG